MNGANSAPTSPFCPHPRRLNAVGVNKTGPAVCAPTFSHTLSTGVKSTKLTYYRPRRLLLTPPGGRPAPWTLPLRPPPPPPPPSTFNGLITPINFPARKLSRKNVGESRARGIYLSSAMTAIYHSKLPRDYLTPASTTPSWGRGSFSRPWPERGRRRGLIGTELSITIYAK